MQERVLERLRGYVEFESPSGDIKRVNALGDRIAGDLAGAGATIEWFDGPGWGRHMRASVEGADPLLEPVLIIGHFDTVHAVGSLETMPFRVDSERASGPGIFDMKAGIALTVEVLQQMRAAGTKPRRTVRALFTCDEEVGSRSSRPLIEESARGSAAVLVLEPSLPGGAAKTGRKGVASYTIRITGKAAHAGIEPDRGVSAITELAHQIMRVLSFADRAKGTTTSVGVVRGGTKVNVIAAEAYAEVDVRTSTMAEAERIKSAMSSLTPTLPGATVHVEEHDSRPPLERTPGVVALYEKARAAAHDLGFELGEGSTGGGSDGNLTAALGIPTLDGLGVQGGGAHAIDEHILVADIPRRVALINRLLETL
jgi:glutamate carboxypeptidase